MTPELGHFALALAVALAAAQAVIPLWGAHLRDARLMAAAPALALGQLIALATSYGCLMRSALVDDFSVLNIAENSSALKPLIYKITGTWGNHEGSILLWCLILALCGGAVATFGRNLPSALRARVIGVLACTSAGFLLFALTTSNPFLRVWPPPVDGRDMNPLLQDPGLAIHPPVLYAGYVGFAIPFAFAVAALLEGKVDAAWGRWVRPWALASWCLLTCGIALGSWWAYYELGWGGYWFWDPVENASLLPWLTGTALVHSSIVVEKREALKTWTILLAIATFSLSLSGTFLVRSGILNSVHAFANDPARGVFILGLLALVIGGALLLFAIRAPALASSGLFAPISREGALVLNNILLCSIAAVVLTGTTYPLFADLLLGLKISVGPPYFQTTVLPLAMPVFAAMAVGPVLSWKRAALGPALLKLWWAALIATVVGVIAALGFRRGLPALAFGLAAWLIAGAFAEIVERIRLFRIPLGSSRARLAAQPASVWGSTIAHAGYGRNDRRHRGHVAGRQYDRRGEAGRNGAACGLFVDAGAPLRRDRTELFGADSRPARVERNGRPVVLLHPSRRAFTTQRQTVTNTAIRTNGLADLYAVLGEEREGAAVLRLHYNPLAPWIWLGALVMAIGGALSLSDRRLRIGAPARRSVPVATSGA